MIRHVDTLPDYVGVAISERSIFRGLSMQDTGTIITKYVI